MFVRSKSSLAKFHRFFTVVQKFYSNSF
jgi:hypothetical protein